MGLGAARPRRGNFSRLGPVRGRPGCDVVCKASTGQSKPTKTTPTHLPFRFISLSKVFPEGRRMFPRYSHYFLRRPRETLKWKKPQSRKKAPLKQTRIDIVGIPNIMQSALDP